MILLSFSSAEDVLSNDVKKYDIFLARKVLRIRRSALFWGDTGIRDFGLRARDVRART